MSQIKMVAVDMDGTFCRSDHSFDEERFRRILARMDAAGCRFVVASGNQYFQLRDFFPGYDARLAFVAENGAYVKDRDELVYVGEIDRRTVSATLDWIDAHPGIANVMSGLEGAYVERGRASERFFEIMGTYYHRLAWVDSLREVDDAVLKFALSVPEAETYAYLDEFKASLTGGLDPTTSGHGAIDLIVAGCHKASGLERLTRRWGIDPACTIAFGDGGNDVEMLRYVGRGYAMANASDDVKAVADEVCGSNDEDGVLEVLDVLF